MLCAHVVEPNLELDDGVQNTGCLQVKCGIRTVQYTDYLLHESLFSNLDHAFYRVVLYPVINFHFNRDYLDRAAEEINETLQEAGQVFVSELSKTFGLSVDFLLTVSKTISG